MSMTTLDPTAGGSAARSTRGKTPIYFPKLNGEEFDITVNEMKLDFVESQHDSVELTCISTTLTDTKDFVDSPISFYWGVAPRTQLFYGYITEVTEEQKSQGQLSFKLLILGLTKMLFEGSPRFWSSKSITNAARDLASAGLLGLGGHKNDYLWTALAQSEESDWTMINRLAHRAGWSVFHRSGVILLYDPVKLYQESGAYTKLMSGLDDLSTDDRTMISFDSTKMAKFMPINLGIRLGYFTTKNEVQLAKQPGEFKGYKFETSLTCRNGIEATQRLKAFDTTIERWGESGVARIWGDADIYPGMCVDVISANPRYRFVATDGRWLVRGASHQADRQQYQTLLFLVRPDKRTAPTNTVYHPFWEEEPGGARAKPVVSLLDERWVSSWRVPA